MSHVLSRSTPRGDHFRMPGEFEPHTGCWMLWPTRGDVWREQATPARRTFAQVAHAIAQFEPVTVGANRADIASARARLPHYIDVQEIPYNDCWVRDNGPMFVISHEGQLAGIDWDFNAWGGLYKDVTLDKQTTDRILQLTQTPKYNGPIILEGGSIDVDGQGTLLTTKECLLNPNRNPHLSQSDIEETLRQYLNIEKFVWLGPGVADDETDGHIDNIACFVRPGEVALTWTDDPQHPQYDISHEAYEHLRTQTDAQGRPITVHKLHQPDDMFVTEEEANGLDITDGTLERPVGDRLAASYVNYYIANGGIVMPLFGQERYDTAAQRKLQELYPNRQVVGVYSREILLGGGNIHCITQQQPAPPVSNRY